jgi:hypothetical protein
MEKSPSVVLKLAPMSWMFSGYSSSSLSVSKCTALSVAPSGSLPWWKVGMSGQLAMNSAVVVVFLAQLCSVEKKLTKGEREW